MDRPSAGFDLEVVADRQALEAVPRPLLFDGEGLVVIDEVQLMPQQFEGLRPVSDDSKRRIVFLLLGRTFLDFVKGISETLAGRIRLIDVNGFSLSEDWAGEPRPL